MGTWLTSHIGENESKEVSLDYKLIDKWEHILVKSMCKCASFTFNILTFVPHRDKNVKILAIHLYK